MLRPEIPGPGPPRAAHKGPVCTKSRSTPCGRAYNARLLEVRLWLRFAREDRSTAELLIEQGSVPRQVTIYNVASSQYSQTVCLIWWSIGMVLAAVYFIVIYHLFRGNVRLEDKGY